MKTTSILSVGALILVLSTLVGCGGSGSTTSVKDPVAEQLAAIQKELNDQKTRAADEKKALEEKLKELTKPAPADGTLDATIKSQRVDSFHLAQVPGEPVVQGQPAQDEANGLIIIRGRKTASEVMRAREVQAHICVVPPTFLPQPTPTFVIPAAPAQQALPGVQPVAPVPPVVAPMLPPAGALPAAPGPMAE